MNIEDAVQMKRSGHNRRRNMSVQMFADDF